MLNGSLKEVWEAIKYFWNIYFEGLLLNWLPDTDIKPEDRPMNQEPPKPDVVPPIQPPSNRQKLYDVAYAAVGTDVTPRDSVPDELACASCVSRLIQKALPEMNFPAVDSTRGLFDYMSKSPSFRGVQVASRGTIIIAVTGTGNGNIPHGHCGIVGKNLSPDGTLYVMSNDSASGFWRPNFTIQKFKNYFRDRGGYPLHFFDLV